MRTSIINYINRKATEKDWKRETLWRNNEEGKMTAYQEGNVIGCHSNVATMSPLEYYLCKTFVWGGWGWGETALNAIKAIGTGLVGLGLLLLLPLYPLFILFVSLTKPSWSRKFLREHPYQ